MLASMYISILVQVQHIEYNERKDVIFGPHVNLAGQIERCPRYPSGKEPTEEAWKEQEKLDSGSDW